MNSSKHIKNIKIIQYFKCFQFNYITKEMQKKFLLQTKSRVIRSDKEPARPESRKEWSRAPSITTDRKGFHSIWAAQSHQWWCLQLVIDLMKFNKKFFWFLWMTNHYQKEVTFWFRNVCVVSMRIWFFMKFHHVMKNEHQKKFFLSFNNEWHWIIKILQYNVRKKLNVNQIFLLQNEKVKCMNIICLTKVKWRAFYCENVQDQ